MHHGCSGAQWVLREEGERGMKGAFFKLNSFGPFDVDNESPVKYEEIRAAKM